MNTSNVITIKPVAYPGAPVALLGDGLKKFISLYPGFQWKQVEDTADVTLFLSGGSEPQAVAHIDPRSSHLLCASVDDNAFAAAAEVSASLRMNGIRHALLQYTGDGQEKTLTYLHAILGLKSLKGKRLGLIGKVSPWLVASQPDPVKTSTLFAIELVQVPWEDIIHHDSFTADPAFLSTFAVEENNPEAIKAAKVYSQLKDTVTRYQLDAITVDCFPMAGNDKVTACLALSRLNDEDIVAACEGDVPSALGMMIAHSITAQPAWMANLSGSEDDRIAFVHCSIPGRMTVSSKLETHYETRCSLAIQGELLPGTYTIFRLQQDLACYSLITGRKTMGKKHLSSCRSQMWVEMPANERELLMSRPLGNHHVLCHGQHAPVIEAMMALVGMAKA